MKKSYEVAFYEYGLTKRITKRFVFELTAYLWKAWQEYRYKDFACIEIREVIND